MTVSSSNAGGQEKVDGGTYQEHTGRYNQSVCQAMRLLRSTRERRDVDVEIDGDVSIAHSQVAALLDGAVRACNIETRLAKKVTRSDHEGR